MVILMYIFFYVLGYIKVVFKKKKNFCIKIFVLKLLEFGKKKNYFLLDKWFIKSL